MTALFLLWHFKIGPQDDFDDEAPDVKLIGVYSAEENATAAIRRLSDKPGFREWPGGFRIFGKTLDRDSWIDGFVDAYAEDEADSATGKAAPYEPREA